ncbi:hypothetical protein M2277_005827 [Paenibacillus sp. LBL]|nr:hypothetical protein [Paenibacillus sp. LBL]
MMFCEMPTPFKERIRHNSLANDVNGTAMLLSQKKHPRSVDSKGTSLVGYASDYNRKIRIVWD